MMSENKLTYGKGYTGSREALARELEAIKHLSRAERLVLGWLFNLVWPAGAPAMQPAQATAVAVADGLEINHKAVRPALRQLQEKEIIALHGRENDPAGRWVEIQTEALFEVRSKVDGSSDSLRDSPSPAAVPVRNASPLPRTVTLQELSESLDRLQQEVVQLRNRVKWLEGRMPDGEPSPSHGEGRAGALPAALPTRREGMGSAPRSLGRPPHFSGERSLQRFKDDDEKEFNPNLHHPPLRDREASRNLGRPPGSNGEASPADVRLQALTLGPVDVGSFVVPHERERLDVAVGNVAYMHSLFERFVQRGHVEEAELEDVLAFLLAVGTKAYRNLHAMRQPGPYVCVLIVKGDWRLRAWQRDILEQQRREAADVAMKIREGLPALAGVPY